MPGISGAKIASLLAYKQCVSVAQRMRASVSGTEGRRFESCRGHFCRGHTFPNWNELAATDIDDPVYRIATEVRDSLTAVIEDFITRGSVASQGDLATKLGLPRSTFSRWVRGTVWPDTRTLALLEVALERPIWPSAAASDSDTIPEALRGTDQ